MTVGFDRTADCQGNQPSLTEFLRILTEHYWLCFDRTTSLTEHLGNLGFDRTVNGEMFCQKNVISRVFCHIKIKFNLNQIVSAVIHIHKNSFLFILTLQTQ